MLKSQVLKGIHKMLEVLKTQHIGICFGPSNSANRNG